MIDSTDNDRTRPLPERAEAVIATLPECPAWCDRKHDGYDKSFGASVIHQRRIATVEIPGDGIGEVIEAWCLSAPASGSAART